MEGWRGRVAVVTGAGSGIGAAVSCRLLKEGLTVFGLDVNLGSMLRLVSTLDAREKKVWNKNFSSLELSLYLVI